MGGLGWQKRGLGLPGPPGPSADPRAVPLDSEGKGWGSWLPAAPQGLCHPHGQSRSPAAQKDSAGTAQKTSGCSLRGSHSFSKPAVFLHPLDQVCGLGPDCPRQTTSPLKRAGCLHTRGQTTSMGTACQAGATARGDGIKPSCSTASPAPPR